MAFRRDGWPGRAPARPGGCELSGGLRDRPREPVAGSRNGDTQPKRDILGLPGWLGAAETSRNGEPKPRHASITRGRHPERRPGRPGPEAKPAGRGERAGPEERPPSASGTGKGETTPTSARRRLPPRLIRWTSRTPLKPRRPRRNPAFHRRRLLRKRHLLLFGVIELLQQ